MTNREMIDEGKFMLDASEIPISQHFPAVMEKEAEINEARQRQGLPQIEIDYDTLTFDEDAQTLYADSYILCQLCNVRIDMRDATEVEDGRCSSCSDIMRALNEPMQTPDILARMEQEMRQ